MEKLKKIYRENRVLVILLSVVIICFVIILIALFKYFYIGDNNMRGDRLDDAANVPIKEERLTDLTMELKENVEVISSAEISPSGNTFYFTLYFQPEVTLEEAKTLASKTLDEFSTEEKAVYDFQFALRQEATENSDGFKIDGARNAEGAGTIVWGNPIAVKKDANESE